MDFNDLNKFLDLVQNADTYAAKVKELTDRAAQIERDAAKLGKLQEAETILVKAKNTLAKAEEDSKAMVAASVAAEEKRKEILNKEFDEARQLKRVAGDIRQQGVDSEKRAKDLFSAAVLKEKEANRVITRYENLCTEVDRQKVELTERLAKLRSVMA